MPNQIEVWFKNIPIITKLYMVISTLTSLAVTLDLLTPFQLYLNFHKIFKNYEFHRIITSFLYFDKFGINLIIFHEYFLYTYSRRLEEHSFHGKSGDYLFMILVGVVLITAGSYFFDLPFLSHALLMMIVYVWSRKTPFEQIRVFGLFLISANWISYVFLGLSLFFGQSPVPEILGIFVGHIYWFGTDVLKKKYDFALFRTPKFIKLALNDEEAIEEDGEDEDIVINAQNMMEDDEEVNENVENVDIVDENN